MSDVKGSGFPGVGFPGVGFPGFGFGTGAFTLFLVLSLLALGFGFFI